MVILRPHLGHFIGLCWFRWQLHLAKPANWETNWRRSPQTRLAFPANPPTLPVICGNLAGSR